MAFRHTNILVSSVGPLNRRIFSLTSTAMKSLTRWYRELWTPKPANGPPYQHFTQIGDPVLRSEAAPVPVELIDSKEVEFVIDQMVKVMRKFNCVGIAAPQIGVSLRIFAIEFNEANEHKYTKEVREARKMSIMPLRVFINPELKISNYEKYKHPEGCMSVRGYSAAVERYAGVTVTGVGKLGTPNELKLSGWCARIAQHEMDHLNGKLYVDHMDTSTFSCICWEVVNAKSGRIEIPFYK